jgi:hypothetical protein
MLSNVSSLISQKGVRLAQNRQVGPRIRRMENQLQRAEEGPTSGPARCHAHFRLQQRHGRLEVETADVLEVPARGRRCRTNLDRKPGV